MRITTLLIVFFAWNAVAVAQSASPSPSAPPALAPLPGDGFVRAGRIISDFAANPDAAVQKYTGRPIGFYGMVDHLQMAPAGGGRPVIVYLSVPGRPTPFVEAQFPPGYLASELINIAPDGTSASLYKQAKHGHVNDLGVWMAKGQEVGIRGAFKGFFNGSIIFEGCEQLHGKSLKKLLKKDHSGGN